MRDSDEDLDEGPAPIRECPNCGGPLPVDGECSCAGDPEQDMRFGFAELRRHKVVVETGAAKLTYRDPVARERR